MRSLPLVILVLPACAGDVSNLEFQAALDRIDDLEARLATLDDTAPDTQLRPDLDALYDRVTEIDNRNVLGVIDTATTLTVPGDQPNLAEALAWTRRYALQAPVLIQLADGTYDHNVGLDLGHPDGRYLRIQGNLEEPSQVVLQFQPGPDGLLLMGGSALDGLSGVTVRAAGPTEAVGVWVAEGSSLRCRGPVVIDGFAEGLWSAYGSSVRCDGAIARNNVGIGFGALRGSSLRVRNALSENNGGHGFVAIEASAVDARGSVARQNGSEPWMAGFAAGMSSSLNADGTTAEDGSGHGYAAWANSAVSAHDATSQDNGGDGFAAEDASYLGLSGAAVSTGNHRGVVSARSSAVTSWGNLTVDRSRDDGLVSSGASVLEVDGATVSNSGSFGANVYWHGFMMSNNTLIRDSRWDVNVAPTSDPTATVHHYRNAP